MRLYGYFNSSTSYRVRIALALKGVAHETLPINLREGRQREAGYLALNRAGGMPLLEDGALRLSQSLAIIDHLDAQHPSPRLLPAAGEARSRVLEFAQLIACDIHPVNNLRVLKYLKEVLGANEAQVSAWYRHWVAEGLSAAEALLARHGTPPFCFGDQPTLADCCLVPQVTNVLRMGCALDTHPRVMAVHQHCMGLPAFANTAPQHQPDFIAAPAAR